MDADNTEEILLDGDGNSSSIELSIIDTSQNAQDDTLNYQTADEDNGSKYFSMIEVDSTLEASCNPDLSLENKLEQSQRDSTLNSTEPLENEPKSGTFLNSLTNISIEAVNKLHIHERIDAANILSGGIDIFDDNENSVDEHELVIDDDANPSERSDDCPESSVEVSTDMQYKNEDGANKETCSQPASFNEHFDMFKNVSKNTEESVGKVEIVKPADSILVSKEACEGTKKEDQVNKEITENVEETETKADNYSALLQGNLPEGSSEVVLLIDDKNVEAVHIGENIYIYKNTEGDLTAIQIALNEDGTPNIKFLHVGKNEDGNLEVYEEQVNQIAVTNEELESMKSVDQSTESIMKETISVEPTLGETPLDVKSIPAQNSVSNVVNADDLSEDAVPELHISDDEIEDSTNIDPIVLEAINTSPMKSFDIKISEDKQTNPCITKQDIESDAGESLNLEVVSADITHPVDTNNYVKENVSIDVVDKEIAEEKCSLLSDVSSPAVLESVENAGLVSKQNNLNDESCGIAVVKRFEDSLTSTTKPDNILKNKSSISIKSYPNTSFSSDESMNEKTDSFICDVIIEPQASKVDDLKDVVSAEKCEIESDTKLITEKSAPVINLLPSDGARDENKVSESIEKNSILLEDKTDPITLNIQEEPQSISAGPPNKDDDLDASTVAKSRECLKSEGLKDSEQIVVETIETTEHITEIITEQQPITDVVPIDINTAVESGVQNIDTVVKETEVESDAQAQQASPIPLNDEKPISEISEVTTKNKLTFEPITEDKIDSKDANSKDDDVLIAHSPKLKTNESQSSLDSEEDLEEDDYVEGEPVTGDIDIEWTQESNVINKDSVSQNDISIEKDSQKTISVDSDNKDIVTNDSLEENKTNNSETKDLTESTDCSEGQQFSEKFNSQVVQDPLDSNDLSVKEIIFNSKAPKDVAKNITTHNIVNISESINNVIATDSDKEIKDISHSSPIIIPLKISESLQQDPVLDTSNDTKILPTPENISIPETAKESSTDISEKLIKEDNIPKMDVLNESPKCITKDVCASINIDENKSVLLLQSTEITKDQPKSLPEHHSKIYKSYPRNQNKEVCKDFPKDLPNNNIQKDVSTISPVKIASEHAVKKKDFWKTSPIEKSVSPTLTESQSPKRKMQNLAKALHEVAHSTSALKNISPTKIYTTNIAPEFPIQNVTMDISRDVSKITGSNFYEKKFKKSPIIDNQQGLLSAVVDHKKDIEKAFESEYIATVASPEKLSPKRKMLNLTKTLESNLTKTIESNLTKTLESKLTAGQITDSTSTYEFSDVHSPTKYYSFKSKLPQPKTYSPGSKAKEIQHILHKSDQKNEVNKPNKLSDLNRNVTAVREISYADEEFDGSLTLNNHVFSKDSKLKTYSSAPKTYSKIGPHVSNLDEQEITLLILNEDGTGCVLPTKPQNPTSSRNAKFTLPPSNQTVIPPEDLKSGLVKDKSCELDTVDNDPNSSADESTTSEHSQKNKSRQPRKQVFTPVTRSDVEIIFPNLYESTEDGNMDGSKPVPKSRGRKRKSEISKMVALDNFNEKKENTDLKESERCIKEHRINDNINVTVNEKTETTEDITNTDESHKTSSSVAENEELLENKSTNNIDSAMISPLSSSAKRKRGRPKKITSINSHLSNSSISDETSPTKSIPDSERKSASPQFKDDAISEKVVPKMNPISPFGKINESIVCPICFKTFRTENVLLKHVKHCNGVIDKELVKSPKKRKLNTETVSNKTNEVSKVKPIEEASITSEGDKSPPKTPRSSCVSSKNKSLTNEKSSNIEVSPEEPMNENLCKTPKLDVNLENDIPIIDHSSDKTENASSTADNKSEIPTPTTPIDSPEVITIDDSVCDLEPAVNSEQGIIIDTTSVVPIKNETIDKELSDSIDDTVLIKKGKGLGAKKYLSEKNGNVSCKAPREKMVGGGRKPIVANQSTASPMSRLSKILSVKPPVNSVIACEICGKTFRQLAHMVYHRSKHTVEESVPPEIPKVEVNIQTKQTVLPEDASDRLDSHAILKCEICHKGFRKLHHLVEHREVHINNESKSRRTSVASTKSETEAGFRCDTCDKSFRKLHHLVEHRDLHMSELIESPLQSAAEPKPVPEDATCSGCGKSFRKRHHMVEHRDIHCSPSKKSKSENSQQAEGSNVRLSTASSTSDDGNNCGICGKSYRKLHHMIEHRESHLEIVPKQESPKVVTNPESDLLSTKDIIHECSKCYMVFPNENSLTKHTTICFRKKLLNRAKSTNIEKTEEASLTDTNNRILPRSKSLVMTTEQGDKANDSDCAVASKPPLEIIKPKQNNIPTKSVPTKIAKPTLRKSLNNEPKSIKREIKKSIPDADNEIKYKINPAFVKAKRRLSQPLDVKPAMTKLKSKRTSESALSGLHVPNAKVLKTILEESTILYSFPKTPKANEKVQAGKLATTQSAKRKSNVTTPVSKKAPTESKITVPKKKTVVPIKRKSIGGRKSLDGKSLPGVGKKLQLRCCGQIFNSQATLATHRKSHKASRPVHKCDCGKAFDNDVLLKKHMDTEHTPPKSYKCTICGASVRTAVQFAKHKRDHVAENNKKSTQPSTSSKAKSVSKNLNKTLSAANTSKVKTPETVAGKTVKRKVAHGGVPLSEKMKKAIAGAKF